jgi:hypothetical protein
MSPFAALDAVDCVFVAPVVFAPCILDIDHFQELVFAAMRRTFPLDAVECAFLALVVVAPLIRDIDHFVGFVFAAMSPFATLDAVACEFVALVVFAPLTHDINHCRELMGAAMRPFATLDAVACAFLALVVVAPFNGDIDESVRFAMFRAMRWFSTFTTIIRLFLLRAAILTKPHIIAEFQIHPALSAFQRKKTAFFFPGKGTMPRPTRFLSNPSAYVIPDPLPIEPTPTPTPVPTPTPAAVEPTHAPAPTPIPIDPTPTPIEIEVEAPPIALDHIDVVPARKPRAKKIPAALPAVAE